MKIKKESKENLYNTLSLLYLVLIFGVGVVVLVVIFSNNAIAEIGAPPPGPGNSNGGGPYNSKEDWIIQEKDNITRSNQSIILSGNISIENGGNLTLRNVTLIMNCSFDGEFRIVVKDGSRFFIYDYDNNSKTTNDRSNITANNKDYEFEFLVNNSANFVMKNSELSECGYDFGDDGKAGLTIKTNKIKIENSSFHNNFHGICFYSLNKIQIANNSIYGNYWSGIYLSSSNNSKIVQNYIFNNSEGISLHSSNDNKIINNTIIKNIRGLRLSSSNNNNQIINNTIYSNNGDGIWIQSGSNNNQIIKNNISSNECGIRLQSSIENQIINNTVTNNIKGISFQSSSNDNKIYNNDMSNDEYCIQFQSSNNNLITKNTVSESDKSIWLQSSNTNQFINNNVLNNKNGIFLENSRSNQITNSTIFNSTDYDFYFKTNSNISALNTTFDKEKVYFRDERSELIINWYLSIRVLYKNLTSVSNANVRLQDNENGEYDETFRTNSEGFIKTVNLTEYIENMIKKKYYTPYTITSNKDNKENSTEIEMNQSKEITIILDREINDWIVNQTEIRINETINLTGNLIIEESGNLTFRNVTLKIDCSKDGEFGIVVKEGGKFYIFDYDNNPKTTNDRSIITANNTEYEFKFLVNSSVVFVMKNSELRECGYYWSGEDGRRGLTVKTNNTIIDNSTFNDNYYDIYFYHSNNNTITNNNFSNSTNGFGIYLSSSNTSQISNNRIFNTSYGIYLSSSNNNQISNNSFSKSIIQAIFLSSSNKNEIKNNILSNNSCGIYLMYSNNNNITNNSLYNITNGIFIQISNCNIIAGNNISKGYYGIYISQSLKNIITNSGVYFTDYCGIFISSSNNIDINNNSVCSNILNGISLSYSNNIKMRDNIMNTNKYNFGVEANDFSHFYHDIDPSNTINGKSIYYINNQTNLLFDNSMNIGYLGIITCSNIVVKNLSLSKNIHGILFVNTTSSLVENCMVSNNKYGISLLASSNNNIIKNNISDNENGIYLTLSSEKNQIIKNIFYSNINCGINLYSSNDNLISNNNISFSTNGFYIFSSNNNQIININASYNGYGVYVSFSKDNQIINSTISESLINDFRLDSYSKIIVINTTFNKSKVYSNDVNSELIVKWYLSIKVLNNNKEPVHFAKIRIQDNKNGTYDNNFTTGSEGFVRWINITEYIEKKIDGKIYYNPYIITAENGNQIKTIEIEINQSKEITIILDREIINWIVTGKEVHINETIFLTGNLIIENSGNLTLKNVTLVMNCSKDGEFGIEVKDSGIFNILDYDNNPTTKYDRSNITSINSEYEFGFFINTSAEFIMKNSELSECGYDWSGEEGERGLTIKTDNAVIENSYLHNNLYGIYIDFSNNIQIINNNISNNFYGINFHSSSKNQIRNNNILENSFGIFMSNSNNDNEIINNDVNNNNYGIYLASSGKNQMSNNYIFKNTYGILLQLSNNNSLINNKIFKNTFGINFQASSNNTILNNDISTSDYSIYFASSNNNTIMNSTITNSIMYDFYLLWNPDLTVINTTFNKNKVYFHDENSEIFVKWYLFIKVMNATKHPIIDAEVRIHDNENGTYDKTFTTDSQGIVNWIECFEYNETKNGKTYYTPYNISVSKNNNINQTGININATKIISIIIEDKTDFLAIKITNPKNNDFVKNIVWITAEIENATNLECISFYIENIEVQNSTSDSFEWNTKDYENKVYTIIVIAQDKNYIKKDEIKVTLNNEIYNNHAPVIVTSNVLKADIFEQYFVNYDITDPNISDSHIWSLKVNLKSDATWLDINENGVLFGTPTQKDIGSYWVNITVSDSGTPQLSDYTEFTLVVDDFPDIKRFRNDTLGVTLKLKYKGLGIVTIEEPINKPVNMTGFSNIKNVEIILQESMEIIWANITMHYSDFKIPKDNKGKSLLEENSIKLYYFVNSEWRLIENNGLDLINKIAWANISHFTIFGLFGEEITVDVEPKIEILEIDFQMQVLEGDNININVTIKNICTIPISNFSVNTYWGDKLISSKVIKDVLDVGEETTISLKWTAVFGKYTVHVEVKTSNGDVLDQDESSKILEVKKVEVSEDEEEEFPTIILLLLIILLAIILIFVVSTIKKIKSKKDDLDKTKEDKKEKTEEINTKEKEKTEEIKTEETEEKSKIEENEVNGEEDKLVKEKNELVKEKNELVKEENELVKEENELAKEENNVNKKQDENVKEFDYHDNI